MAQYDKDGRDAAFARGALEDELEMLRRERDEAVAARESALDMLATFTHELRTPLTGILGVANLLLGTRLDADQGHFARTIWDSGTHLRRLVDDVVELSILESRGFQFEKAPANPREIVRSVLDIVGPEAKKKEISLSWQIEPGLDRYFMMDAARFRQVLLNLTANAIRYTDEGSVRIEGAVDATGRDLLFAKFTVSDTGLGMSEEARASLFARFTRAGPRDRRGAGLGLAISRQIVELMDGRIEVESAPGQGSRFSVFVPLAPAEKAVTAAPEYGARAASGPAVSLDLLLVEDDELNQMYFETLLRAGGHDVTVAENGMEALDFASQRSFHAILMDIQMPVMDGIAATKAIRALPGEKGKVPVIALTGGVDRKGGMTIIDAGFTSGLTKPLEEGELAAALSKATGHPVYIPDYAVEARDAPPLSKSAADAIENFIETVGAGQSRRK